MQRRNGHLDNTAPRRRPLIRLGAFGAIALAATGLVVWDAPSGPRPGHADDSVVLAVIGDYGTNNSGEYAVSALVRSWQPDAVATVGDNMYVEDPVRTGTDRFDLTVGNFFCEFLGGAAAGPECTPDPGAPNRFFPATGNHDYEDGPISAYLDYFDLPGPGTTSRSPSGSELYYDVDLGAVHLFVVDSQEADRDPANPGLVPLATQRTWLEAALRSSTAPWQLVLFHHPPYSSGGSWLNTTAMQWPFAEWGADIVFSGHHHAYERIERDGIVYQVVGLGGAGRYPFGDVVAGSVVRYNDNEGAFRLTADADRLVGEFVAVDGTSIDRYELVSPPTTAPPTTAPPTTAPPTTAPPTTLPPTTVPPSTDPVATAPATTSPATGGGTASGAVIAPPPPPTLMWTRLGGADRYATAVAASSDLAPGVDVVTIVNGRSFADAAAAAAAGAGPILLTEHDRLPASTVTELVRLSPARVLIIGGEQAVTMEVEDRVRATLRDVIVERVDGADRYSTVAQLTRSNARQVSDATVWVASGERFPDALVAASAARLAGRSHHLLLTPSNGLPAVVADALRAIDPARVMVVGGEAAIPPQMIVELESLTGVEPERLAGRDRVETALRVADHLRGSVSDPFGATPVHLVTELDFADALGAVGRGGFLLYSTPLCLPADVGDAIARWEPRLVVVMGGTRALSDGVLQGVRCAPR